MRGFVVDASVAIKWLVDEPGAEIASLLLDQDSKVATSWPVKGLPTTYVVDPEGRLAYRAIGGREWDDPGLLESIRQLHGAAMAQ